MPELRIDIEHLVLRDVPPAWLEGLGPQIEQAVAAAAAAQAGATLAPSDSARPRRSAAADREAFAADVGRQIWASVRGGIR